MINLIAKFFFARGRRGRAILVLLCVLTSLASILEVTGILLIFPLIRLLHNSNFIHETPILEHIYRALDFGHERYFVLAFGGLLLAVFVIKNLYITYVYFLQRRFARQGAAELSHFLQRLYFKAPYIMLVNRNTSELLRNIRNVVPQVYFKVGLGVVNVIADGVVVLGIGTALLFIEPWATLIVAIVVGVLYATQSYVFGSYLARWGAQALRATRDGQRMLSEAFRAFKEIRVLGREEHFLRTLDDIHRREAVFAGNKQFLIETIRPMTEIVMLCGIFIVVALVLLDNDPQDSLPSLALFAVAGIRLVPTLNRLFRRLGDVRNGMPSVRKILSEITRFEDQDIPTKSQAGKLPFKDEIRIENAKFRYPGNRHLTVKLTDAVIHRGQFVGIVGLSGVGKSTLMDLILGLLKPTTGRILIDGRDMAADTGAWQNNIGYVPQNMFFVDDTVRRNVALGIPDDAIDDDRVYEVLALASLGREGGHFPDGLDTLLGEHGVRISGGERRRVGIARALYHDPDVLVLDEATADLDNETERAVIQTLQTMRGEKTIIMVAHRLRSVRDCDTLFFMKNGKIMDSGSFDELYDRRPGFRRLVRLEGSHR